MQSEKPQPQSRSTLPLDGVSPLPLAQDLPVDAETGVARVRPEDMQHALQVIRTVMDLPPAHQDADTLRVAMAGVYKHYKKNRRAAAREKVQQADRDVVAKTATGSPSRIDDETAGIPLVSNAPGATAGDYCKPKPCYVCKKDYTAVDAFYHQLCPECAAINHQRRNASCDLTGRSALLTGGRAKIGMYIALRLLRDGAHTTITTRFPKDAARRFSSLPDASEWFHRLRIVGIDLRDPAQVLGLADAVAARGPLDILINNAAQTVRRATSAYAPIAAAEAEPLNLPVHLPAADILTFERTSAAHPASLLGGTRNATPIDISQQSGTGQEPSAGQECGPGDMREVQAQDGASSRQGGPVDPTLGNQALGNQALVDQALTAGNASLARHLDHSAIDAGGLVPDRAETNSWTQVVDEVDPLELLEVQLCNQTAPFVLVSRLRKALAASPARRKYIVNVSAMEGVFMRGYKGPGHPHTNMSKAALNMLVRTSSAEMFATDQILMTAVDTGWITDERPHFTKVRLAEEGFHAPLDLVDGAARVYDPIVQGEQGNDLYGCFLKDYTKHRW